MYIYRNSAVRTFQNPEDKKEEVIEKPKKPKTKEQQLRGLSRKEKRKKMMRSQLAIYLFFID